MTLGDAVNGSYNFVAPPGDPSAAIGQAVLRVGDAVVTNVFMQTGVLDVPAGYVGGDEMGTAAHPWTGVSISPRTPPGTWPWNATALVIPNTNAETTLVLPFGEIGAAGGNVAQPGRVALIVVNNSGETVTGVGLTTTQQVRDAEGNGYPVTQTVALPPLDLAAGSAKLVGPVGVPGPALRS